MRRPFLILTALFLVATAIHVPAHAQDNSFANPALKPSTSPLQDARLDGIDPDSGQLSVTDCAQPKADSSARPICQGTAFNLTVSDAALKTKLKQLHIGDHIRVAFDTKLNVSNIAGPAVVYISTGRRLLVLFTCAFFTFALGAILTQGHPLKLILGQDNRYSNSKLQVAAWFLVLITSYLEVLYFRIAAGGFDFLGGINIPQNLLLLSGMSALTFAGAKAITTSKVNAATAPTVDAVAGSVAVETSNVAVVAQDVSIVGDSKASPKKSGIAGEESFWNDIVKNDLGHFDFGDFQMVIVTLLAMCTYMLSVHNYLGALDLTSITSLPDVDTTILSAFGLGQGAYLAKKAAGNLGTS
jgi:hypothetical protein